MSIHFISFFILVWSNIFVILGSFFVYACIPHISETAKGQSIRLLSMNLSVPLEEHVVMIRRDKNVDFASVSEYMNRDPGIWFLKAWPETEAVARNVNVVNRGLTANRGKDRRLIDVDFDSE